MMQLAVFCTKHCENLRANFCFGALCGEGGYTKQDLFSPFR